MARNVTKAIDIFKQLTLEEGTKYGIQLFFLLLQMLKITLPP